MRIMYLTQWFDPEPNIVKGPRFVRAVEAAGHRVDVVTGLPNYPSGRIYPGYTLKLVQRDEIEGARITRLPLYASHSQSSVGRALNFVSFFISALAYGIARAGRYDLIYAYHPPITTGIAAALISAIRRVPFVLCIQDMWPDTVIASGMRGTRQLGPLLNAMCNFVYRRATIIMPQSKGMRELLISRGVPADKVVTTYEWADEPAAAIPPTDPAKPRHDRLTMLYAGNIGRAQALAAFVRAAAIADRRGAKVDLVLVGEGIERAELERLAQELGAGNVFFKERVDRFAIADLSYEADILVLHLDDYPHFRVTIPSKIEFYLAAGKPILAGIAGEGADVLNASGAAEVVAPNDADGLSAAMERMARLSQAELAAMGARGRAFYDRTFSFDAGMATQLDVIAEAGRRAGRSVPPRA